MPRVTVETNEHQPASGRFAARTGAEILASAGVLVTSGGDLLSADSGGRVRAVSGAPPAPPHRPVPAEPRPCPLSSVLPA
jgi:hypothetical protein